MVYLRRDSQAPTSPGLPGAAEQDRERRRHVPRKRAKGDAKAKDERARLGDLGVAGVSRRRGLYEACSPPTTRTAEDGIQQKVAELWTHDAVIRTARDGYLRPSWDDTPDALGRTRGFFVAKCTAGATGRAQVLF